MNEFEKEEIVKCLEETEHEIAKEKGEYSGLQKSPVQKLGNHVSGSLEIIIPKIWKSQSTDSLFKIFVRAAAPHK